MWNNFFSLFSFLFPFLLSSLSFPFFLSFYHSAEGWTQDLMLGKHYHWATSPGLQMQHVHFIAAPHLHFTLIKPVVHLMSPLGYFKCATNFKWPRWNSWLSSPPWFLCVIFTCWNSGTRNHLGTEISLSLYPDPSHQLLLNFVLRFYPFPFLNTTLAPGPSPIMASFISSAVF